MPKQYVVLCLVLYVKEIKQIDFLSNFQCISVKILEELRKKTISYSNSGENSKPKSVDRKFAQILKLPQLPDMPKQYIVPCLTLYVEEMKEIDCFTFCLFSCTIT